jgi:hypothetical protein
MAISVMFKNKSGTLPVTKLPLINVAKCLIIKKTLLLKSPFPYSIAEDGGNRAGIFKENMGARN